jgi:Tfp pilus assembly protein PilF
VYLQLDDENAYNELCTRILARFGSVTNDPRIADRMAKTCLMLPPKGQDLITAAKLANVAVTFDTKAAAHPWFHFCKGFAEYRQGKFESAKHWMEKVLEHEADGSTRDVEAYMILAMSEQMLHHDKAAQVAYAKGTKLARRRLRDENSGDIESGWTDWILAHRLMREAQAMTTDNSQEPAPPETLSAP